MNYIFPGIGNAIVAQLIYVLNGYYGNWRETTLFMAGILSLIILFGALFRPVEFTLHRKEKNYHHTMQDKRLPPSCMTSIEKLHRFISAMDKQCAQRQAHNSTGPSTSIHDRVSGTLEDHDAISIANESDLFDSYSAGDITEIQHENSPKIDMLTFREKIFNDMTFINERWKNIKKRQAESTSNTRLFRVPNFLTIITNRARDFSNTLTATNQTAHAQNDKIHRSTEQLRDRQSFMIRERQTNNVQSKSINEESAHKSTAAIKTGF